MKAAILIIIVCVAIASSLPVKPFYKENQNSTTAQSPPELISYHNDNIGVGPYNFAWVNLMFKINLENYLMYFNLINNSYETSDGQKREEHAQIVFDDEDPEQPHQVISGSYSYIGTDQMTYTVYYTADKNGYHATGAHIPQPQ